LKSHFKENYVFSQLRWPSPFNPSLFFYFCRRSPGETKKQNTINNGLKSEGGVKGEPWVLLKETPELCKTLYSNYCYYEQHICVG